MIRLLLVLAVLLVTAPALASGEEAPSTFLGLPVWLWKTANLVAFFGLLVYLLAKPMRHFFHTRREEIGRSLAEASRQRAEAEAMKAEMEVRVASLQGEIGALRERLQRDGERERAELERTGETEAARLLAGLDAEAQRRVEEARIVLAAEAAQAAADMALELLERELTPADRERIFKRTLDRLTAAGGKR